MTLAHLARLVGGEVEGDGDCIIKDVSSIEDAGPGDITFLASPRHQRFLKDTRASAIIVSEAGPLIKDNNLIVVDNPYLAFAKIIGLLRPLTRPTAGLHPSSIIHPSAGIGSRVAVQANVVIEQGSVIGDDVVVYPGVYIGSGVTVGDGSVIYSNVSIREGSIIGKRVVIHCNSVIGSDGFGYVPYIKGYYKIPQTGIVRIGDDSEIGACVTVDRATIGETVIARGTKIDNLVQIAHNVKIGEDCIIVAQVGIAGSAVIGKGVQLAGQAGIGGHFEIGDNAQIGAQSGVIGDIPAGKAYIGSPAMPHRDWLRMQALSQKLPELKKRLEDVEKMLKKMEAAAKAEKPSAAMRRKR
ncbi:MAG: UDP-3-O-(3-hydroxymyristoyl)glucosamine N-acyltransferase [Deltaproteobacteria bacterium]|nr:UDP-3-O-(3-hydroxymyristoyl)glucosamine N-acyltransferase [Deltaproteobacteria bacterium]